MNNRPAGNLNLDRVGRVVKQEPQRLMQAGAKVTNLSPAITAVEGYHFFLCVLVDLEAKVSVWTPLFSRMVGHNRILLNNKHKRGLPEWRNTITHVDVRQFWVLPIGGLATVIPSWAKSPASTVHSDGIPGDLAIGARIALDTALGRPQRKLGSTNGVKAAP